MCSLHTELVRGMIGRRLAREWRAFVHNRCSKNSENGSLVPLRKGCKLSVAAYNLFATNHQRLWRGTRGRIIASIRRKRHFAAIDIQRVCAQLNRERLRGKNENISCSSHSDSDPVSVSLPALHAQN